MNKTVAVSISALFLITGGCAVGPDYERPQVGSEEAWSQAGLSQTVDHEIKPVPGEEPPAEWWKRFDDPVLDELIESATSDNIDLHIALSRIEEARAARLLTVGDFFPVITGPLSYTRQKFSSGDVVRSNNGMSQNGGASGGSIGAGGSRSIGIRDTYRAGFDAAWELDLWGRLRRNTEAATADLRAESDNSRAVLLSVLAEVASNYMDLRAFQRRLDVLRKNVEASQKTLELTRERFKAGLGTQLDVARSEALLATTQSQVPELEAGQAQAIHALAVLVGREPSALDKRLLVPADLPHGADTVPVGVPSDLLRRRPDVRSAENLAAAATARVGVAIADYFPSVSLNGTYGWSSRESNKLFELASNFWSWGPNVSVPIFAGGKVVANVKIQNEREAQAILNYQKLVLTSMKEVEDALANLHAEQQREVELTESVRANSEAVELSNKLFTEGVADFLDLLQAQKDLYVAQGALELSRGQVAKNVVALYKALGGGWENQLPLEEGECVAGPARETKDAPQTGSKV